MGQGLLQLAAACAAFVGAHFVFSNPLRRPLVQALGERGFLAAYSVAALALMVWIVVAFHRTVRGESLWDGTAAVPWIAASVLTYGSVVLVLASLSGNPALPQAKIAGLSARKPWGVFRMTRHPMMMGIALWAAAHIVVSPTARSLILCSAIIVLALAGSALQDRRKLAQTGREWGVWMQRTSFWPDLSQARALGAMWIAGLVVWMALTFGHLYLTGIPAGVWIWLR